MPRFYAGIGSRETPAEICQIMMARARDLAIQGYVLRSGGAVRADTAFEAGTIAGRGGVEIWLPWMGYNGHCSHLIPSPEAFEMAAKFHPAWHRCSPAAKKLHARNCHIILGANLATPVEFVLYWTKDGKASGGTGQGLRIAQAHGIRTELIKLPRDPELVLPPPAPPLRPVGTERHLPKTHSLRRPVNV